MFLSISAKNTQGHLIAFLKVSVDCSYKQSPTLSGIIHYSSVVFLYTSHMYAEKSDAWTYLDLYLIYDHIIIIITIIIHMGGQNQTAMKKKIF